MKTIMSETGFDQYVTYKGREYHLIEENAWRSDHTFFQDSPDPDSGKYFVEFGCLAESDGHTYNIFWRFPTVRGEEPENDDEWPWEQDQYIHEVVLIE